MIKRLAQRFLQWFCHPDYYDEIHGDLEEMYQRNQAQGKRKAQWKYLLQVIVLFRPSLMRSFSQPYLTHPAMIRHYFNISSRVLLRHKLYSAINILGLAVGMGVCLLIFQYIHFELSYDQFHTDSENIYRITQTTIRHGEDLSTQAYTTYGLGPAAMETVPALKAFVRVLPQAEAPIIINPERRQSFLEDDMWYVDSNFLQVFDFPLKYGDKSSALVDKHHMVITEQMAQKYFGNSNPVGKELRVSLGIRSGNFTVAGVLEKLPANGSLQFNFLLPIAFVLNQFPYKKNDRGGWEAADFMTFVVLEKQADVDQAGEQLDRLMATHSQEVANQRQIDFQPLVDIHLRSGFVKDLASDIGKMLNIYAFSVIAVFILLMAWVNYINLSTARAMQRSKEVGVRKAMGAFRKQLIGQFIVESSLINCLAATLAVGISYLMLPVLNNIIGQKLTFSIMHSMEFWLGVLAVIIFGTLLSGLYPAFVLSSFKVINILKSARSTPTAGFSLRKGLITFQFLISVLLISGTYLVYQQITFMKNQDLGIDTEQLLVVGGPRVVLESLQKEGVTLGSKYQAFKNKVVSHHTVREVTATGSVPSKGYSYTEGFWKSDAVSEQGQPINYVIIDTDFTDTYELEFLARENYPKQIAPDQKGIINEEAVKTFGLGTPEEALHQVLTNGGDTVEVLGVVKNFHWSSLKEAQVPMLFIFNNQYGAYFTIRMNLSDIQQTIAQVESAFHEIFPEDPFVYAFLDDDFDQQYQADLQFGNLFLAFSVLAVIIACLGLFALVSYSATLRGKEVGIRKVLGASISHLMILLSREYLILLLIAVTIAIPAVLMGGKAWLENYAYRTELNIDIFLIPGLVLLVIALLTVSYRTYTTATTNPLDSLKTE